MTAADLHVDLQKLLEARFEAMDRVLMRAQISWSERRSIVGEVETQVYELLARRTSTPTLQDVVAVLDSLDPPESYIPEEFRQTTAAEPPANPPQPPQWREFQQRMILRAANFSKGAMYVVAAVTINGLAILFIAASGKLIPWLVTLGLLAWLNYACIQHIRQWSATRSGSLIDDVRHTMAAWLVPKNSAPVA